MNVLSTEIKPTGDEANHGSSSRLMALLRTGALIALAAIAGLVVVRVAIDRLSPHLYSGTVLQQSETAPPLDGLRFATGESVDLAAFDDEVTLVFFGYTNCPDVCPLTLSTVTQALDELSEADRSRVNMLMVSVDPDRDDLVSLQQYVEFFDEDFLGVGGPQAAIDQAASLYGVYYELHREQDAANTTDDAYLVDHTASMMGIDTGGALRVVWPSDITPAALAADLEELLS